MEFWLRQPPAGSPVNHPTAGRQIKANLHILTPTEATGISSYLHELVVVLGGGVEEGHLNSQRGAVPALPVSQQHIIVEPLQYDELAPHLLSPSLLFYHL